MLHLEYRFNEEAFCVPVVADHSQYFADHSASWVTLNMDDEIDRFSDLSFGVGEGCLRMVPHHQIGEAMEGLFCRVGVNRSQRSSVASVEGIEERSRFDSADFAEDDPVWTPAQSRLQKIIERDVRFEGIRLTFDSQDIRLLDAKFRRILDHNDPLAVRNRLRQYVKEGRLPAARSAADQ